MSVITVQNNFTHGELSREGFSRFDTDLYRRAAATLSNVFIKPLGQAERRFGTKYIATITASEDQYRIWGFEYDENESYVLVFTNNNIAVYWQDSFQVNIVTTYTGAQVSSLRFAQTNNLLIITHPDHAPAQLVRGVTVLLWTLSNISFINPPAHDFDKDYNAYTFTLSSAAVGSGRTLTSSTAVFDADDVGGIFQGLGDLTTTQLGAARITAVPAGPYPVTTCTVTITSTFSSTFTTGVKGDQCLLAEPAWTSARGYPISCAFHQARLVFGGAKALPQTVFMSKPDDFFNFDIGTGQDDDAIQVTLATHKRNNIRNIVSTTTLQVFTGTTEFSTQSNTFSGVTPSNIAFNVQSNIGSSNVTPFIYDGATLFVANGGKKIQEFRFDPNSQYYQSENVSILSPQVIDDPVDATVNLENSVNQASYYFVVNADGTLGVYQSIEAENIRAWTKSSTEGEFKRVVAVGNEVFFLVKRTINSVDVTYLEKGTFDFTMDSFITQTFGGGATTITGLTHLEGETVNVIADGYLLENRTVASGRIIIERSSEEVTVGIPYTSSIQLLPIEVMTQSGPSAYLKKRLNRIFIDYYLSLAIKINDEFIIPHLQFGPSVLDVIPPAKTGLYETTIVYGWDARQQIKLSQELPLPMTVLGVGLEVEV